MSFTLLSVAGVMTPRVVTIETGAGIVEAAQKMRDNHIGSLLVMDQGRHVGLVTEREIVFSIVASGKPLSESKVDDIVNTRLETIGPDESIFEAREVIVDKDVEYLIVTENGDIKGIVSKHDLLK